MKRKKWMIEVHLGLWGFNRFQKSPKTHSKSLTTHALLSFFFLSQLTYKGGQKRNKKRDRGSHSDFSHHHRRRRLRGRLEHHQKRRDFERRWKNLEWWEEGVCLMVSIVYACVFHVQKFFFIWEEGWSCF